ncbi:MAG: hypothetical protein EB121_06825 [Alphaproteobacteria bacterium]|nr:hypothetical protein [Alphaproteobacteria bacterium]
MDEILAESENVAEDVCEGDCCASAVKRAYAEMLKDQPEIFAYAAALRVFEWYHPDVGRQKADIIVSHWVRPTQTH